MNGILKNTTSIFLVLLALSAFLFFFGLGERSFRNPDEGRYAEIAKEMVTSGNWLEPRLYGVDYLKKPILFYWLLAVSFKLWGFTEWAARAVPAIFGVFGVLAAFFFAKRFFDVKTAFYSSLILVSNFWYLEIGRYLLIDMVFSFFVVSGLYFFYLGVREPQHSRKYFVLFYACVALSFLSKGVTGLIIPAVTIVPYLLLTKQLRARFLNMDLGLGILIFSLIVLPWFIRISLAQPEFLHTFFFREHVMRFVSSSFEHQERWYYYFALLPVLLMPWSLFPEPLKRAFSVSKEPHFKDTKLFLLPAGFALIVFYSLSKGKLLTYLLPSVPFLSILIGHGWSRWEAEGFKKEPFKTGSAWALALLFVLGGLTIFLTLFFPSLFHELESMEFLRTVKMMAGLVMLGSFLGLVSIRRRRIDHFFYSMALMMALVSFPLFLGMNALNRFYTTKPFAEVLKPKLKPGDLVFIYDAPGAFYDFRFYLNAPVKLVGLSGELELAKGDKEAQGAFVTEEEFYKLLNQRKKVYCLLRKSDFMGMEEAVRKNLVVLSQDERKTLFTNS